MLFPDGEYKNDYLFIGIGPSFRKDDIPGTKDYTYSPCYGPDDRNVVSGIYSSKEIRNDGKGRDG